MNAAIDTSDHAPDGALGNSERLAAFEKKMQLPILVSAILPILLTYGGAETGITETVLVITWFVFVADYVVHVRLQPGYLKLGQGKFDLGVVVLTAPWFLIPGMGTARFLSLARLARLARIAKASGGGIRRLFQQLGTVGIVTGLIILTSAYIAYVAEHPVNDQFADFGDAVWWATETLTTVGYGDIYPITTTGRLAAVVLMFSGLAVLGILAGALASFFGFGNDETADASPPASTNGEPDALDARLSDLDSAIAAVRAEIAQRG